MAGRFASASELNRLKTTRRWAPHTNVTEVSIDANGKVELTYVWHEYASLGKTPWDFGDGCVTLKGDNLTLRWTPLGAKKKEVRHFVAVDNRWFSPEHSYLRALFPSCYMDETGQRWCFEEERLVVGSESSKMKFLMDTVELPKVAAAIAVEDSDQFLVFEPAPKGAWLVHRSFSQSDRRFTPPDWKHPWRVLKPVK